MNSWLSKAALLAAALTLAPAETKSETFKIEVKSFIMPVKFAGVHTIEAGILAAITDANFSENPQSGARSARDFRLWSSAELDVQCNGDRIKSARISEGQIDTGTEVFVLEAKGELALPAELYNLKSDNSTKIRRFRWEMKGRPHAATLAAFYVHDYRRCVWIWHRVEGELTCAAGKPTVELSLAGSRFPSHRVWVNGKLSFFQEQGPFEYLWSCSPTNPALVQ